MSDAVLRLWLKVADATALTARETLQRSMGYGRTVQDVARSEIWAFRWRDRSRPAEVLERLALETNLFHNPNKHRYEIAVGAEHLHPRGNVWVLVSVPGAGSQMGELLARRRLVDGEIPRVRRAELWELTLDGDKAARSRLAREIAVTESHRKGLLSNPHLEDAAVLTAPPGAEEIVSLLAEQKAEK